MLEQFSLAGRLARELRRGATIEPRTTKVQTPA